MVLKSLAFDREWFGPMLQIVIVEYGVSRCLVRSVIVLFGPEPGSSDEKGLTETSLVLRIQLTELEAMDER